MKKILLIVSAVLVAVPFFVSAQTASLPDEFDQMQTSSCLSLKYNLTYRSRDASTNGEVSDLQDFLNINGYLSSEPTGYFGAATVAAVKKFQIAVGIGTSTTPGLGGVGPKSRAKIATMTCGTTATATPIETISSTPTATSVPATTISQVAIASTIPGCFAGYKFSPTTGQSCTTTIPKPIYQSGCTSTFGFSVTTGKSCDASTLNQQPIISGVSGPMTLKVGETGKWEVKASDLEQKTLTYSVVWGDEVSLMYPALASQSSTYIQTTTFTHSYSKAGVYSPTFIVTDNQGLSAKTSISVNVGDAVVEVGAMKITVMGDTGIRCVTTPCPSATILYNAKVSVYNEKGSYLGTKDTSGGTAVFENLQVGVYTAIASASGYEDNKTDFKIVANVGGYSTIYLKKTTTIPSITVLSPNGGESWTKGTTQTIKWQDNTPIPVCPVGALCAQALKEYDIKLTTVCDSATHCLAPYTIAKGVYGSSYSWSVGKILETVSGIISDGPYTIQVCQTGTTTCDSSDSYFKIVSGTSTNNPPVINATPAIQTDIKVDQLVSLSWGATDADGDDLGWSVSWGDGTGVQGVFPVSYSQNKQGWTHTASHSWSKPGTYTVKATVNDNRGGSNEHTSYVVVGTTLSSIMIVSPNGGETWTKGTTQTIKWQDNTPIPVCPAGAACSTPVPLYDIQLIPVCSSDGGCGSPYTIAKTVYGSSYSWLVGKIDMEILGGTSNVTASDGSYTIQVCQAGSNVCDSSDAQFTIASSTVAAASYSNQYASIIDAFSPAPVSAPVSTPTPTWAYSWMRNLEVTSPYRDDVTALQTALAKEGVYSGEITGGFYSQTYGAVKAFQMKYGIESTGFVGQQTRAKLNELFK